MRIRSFRARVILGSLLWTAGLLAVAHIISLSVIHRFPIVLRIGPHSVVLVAVIFMAAGLIGLRSGLSAFDMLRARLAAVRSGRARIMEGDYPTEVQPLVNELNSLLEHRERVVNRALATAGDLAHGLKTPLALLTQEAERAEAAGQTETAASIHQAVDRMRRQVDYHLAHARAVGSGAEAGARCSVAACAEGLRRTVERLYAERGLVFQIDVPAGQMVQGRREDLDEMLGNLLDNACKWARSRVAVASEVSGSSIVISVDDDGPGLAAPLRERVLDRGVRADEAASGSGLGLAIVRELAELYGGSVALEESPMGGLRVRLELPG